eukprot:7133950-Pyramimonas_sp.AAC.1
MVLKQRIAKAPLPLAPFMMGPDRPWVAHGAEIADLVLDGTQREGLQTLEGQEKQVSESYMRFALTAEHLLLEREAGHGTRTFSVAKRGFMTEIQDVLVVPPEPQGWVAKSSGVAKWGALEGRLI